ncbi:MAG: ATP-binding cassette domain-containing protein, partial [Saprospiraceae bacterium]|nr:ATP-binding cassette domain-containing protein [Saprospiraceae bacterium]
ILVVQGLASYGRIYLTAHFAEKSIADIRKDVFENLLTLPITFYEENSSGELISRISSDIGRMYSVFSVQFGELLRQILVLITGIGFLIISTPKLSLIMLATVPVVVILTMVFGRKIRKLAKNRQTELADSNTLIGEVVSSVKVVKAFAAEIFEKDKYDASQGRLISVALKYGNARGLFILFLTIVFLGAIFFIIYMGARMVQNGEMTSGTLISFVTYTFIIGGAIAGLGSLTTELLGAMGATERVREILDLSPELSLSDKKPKKEITGDIKFVDVDFSYPSRKDLQILKKINLDISKGEKVALVGPSGVGKSTIIQLLLKFYHIDSGQILLDELPIQEYELRGLRQNIALVPQEVILFGGSILENIKYGDQNATEDEIIEAAKQANAWSFISNFPEGLNTLIGERGIKLSGGQRQRIAIARAILKNPKILLLDEATSALDTESEKLVQDALNNLMKNRTSIIIAHRLSTITDVDRIYVFQEGRIVEQGNHQTLMQNPEGVYYKQAQMGRLFD